MFDFCYFGNFALYIHLNYAPKCQWLFISCFIYANGTIAASCIAFRNSLVFHKMDQLTSMAIHILPMILMLYIRWRSIPNEQNLPEEERIFASIPEHANWSEWFYDLFVMPIGLYFAWNISYGCFLFLTTDKVRTYEVDSVYRAFTRGIKLWSWLGPVRKLPLPIIFLFGHFVFYFVFHLLAVLLYHSFILNMLQCFVILQVCIYQGACYYMDYFAKKYELQLEKLD